VFIYIRYINLLLVDAPDSKPKEFAQLEPRNAIGNRYAAKLMGDGLVRLAGQAKPVFSLTFKRWHD
jgi:hypothetical protein